jgi:nitrate reductase NapE component
MKRKEEPKLWVTVLKLVVGAVLLIGGVGFALWYVDSVQGPPQAAKPMSNWGIASDSPLRKR